MGLWANIPMGGGPRSPPCSESPLAGAYLRSCQALYSLDPQPCRQDSSPLATGQLPARSHKPALKADAPARTLGPSHVPLGVPTPWFLPGQPGDTLLVPHGSSE